MYAIGVMPMPAGFKYRDVFLKGKPRHDHYDSFRLRHPSMDPGKRAKIFAPFDALAGFSDALTAVDAAQARISPILKKAMVTSCRFRRHP